MSAPVRRTFSFLALLLIAVLFQNCSGGFQNNVSQSSADSQNCPASGCPPPSGLIPPVSTGGGINCAPNPSACGYPDASNTGVPKGVVLKKIPQDVTSGPGWHWDSRGFVAIDVDGTVFDGYEVGAEISIFGDNVTVKNSKVIFYDGGSGFGVAIRHARNATIINCEIGSPSSGAGRLMVGVKDIYADASGTRVLKNNIYHVATGVQIYEGLIEDNYIHNMGFTGSDHINGTTSNGGTTPLTIHHNTIFNQIAQTDAISLFQDFGIEANRLIDDNLLAGGGYTIYAGQNPGAPAAYNIRVTNNRISRLFFPNGGYYGPVTAYNSTAAGNQWTNNRWDDTNELIDSP